MRKIIFTGSIAVILMLAVASLQAAKSRPSVPSEDIRCPVDEIRAEITTALPDPWFQTPQTGRLQRTRIMNIGGKRTLVCEYWAYGRSVGVMREFPAGAKTCTAVAGGFHCL